MTPDWSRDGIELYCADCMDVLPHLSGVDAEITDPPYFLPAQHYATRKQFARSLCDLSMLEFFYRSWFEIGSTGIKDTGCYYIFCDGQSYPVFYVLLYPHVKRSVPLIWDKLVAFNGFSWRHQHELILFAEKPLAKPVKTGDGDIFRYRAVRVDDREHPAEKPIELLEKLITKSVPENGVVRDSFMGSGTTGVACINTGRKFIGIEREPKYFEIACKRISDALDAPKQLAMGER